MSRTHHARFHATGEANESDASLGCRARTRIPAHATALLGYIGQVAGVVEQDELWLELGIRDSDETDAEVRIPAPFCR